MSAEAIDPSVLLGFDNEVMRGVLRESGDTCLRMLASLSGRLRQQVDEIEKLTLHSAVSRLADYLVEQIPRDAHISRGVHLTAPKNVIASRLGIQPETFSRTAARLIKDGLIRVQGTGHRAARRRRAARARRRLTRHPFSTARRNGCKIGPMRILLIEDDPETTPLRPPGARRGGHVVDHAGDGKEGLLLALDAGHDVIVVDRMLPGLDGLSIVRSLRAADRTTPVLVLSALGEVDDRVEGLRAGGDDYLVKPFVFAELSARIETLARRRGGDEAPVTRFVVADLEMDLLARAPSGGPGAPSSSSLASSGCSNT